MNDQPSNPRKQVAAATALIVQSVKTTHYQHRPIIVDPETGTYKLDCSEFVSYVLSNVAPAQYRELPRKHQDPCPLAFDYYDFLDGLRPDPTGGWQRVFAIGGAIASQATHGWRPLQSVGDARPGDVIAWRIPHFKKGHNTGHVMVVADRPESLDASVVAVRVYDSANDPHYDDSRGCGADFQSGVGTGTIRFEVDDEGAPTAFQFGPGDEFHPYPIAIGRLERLNA
jgi:hypothetical protein